ncbi:MAG TPA: hypothetical protein VF599_18275 [Pyrinomonadaceae bacterium]
MRDYWLDSLTDNQTERLETEWFGNDEDAELLEIVRSDLIEDYLTNSLSRNELVKFKNHFLINNPEEVAIAESYLQLSQTPQKQVVEAGFFETLSANWRSFIKIPQIAFAVALLGGLAVFIGFYNSEPVDVAQNELPKFELPDKNQVASNSVAPDNKTNAGEDNVNSVISLNNNQNPGEEAVKSPVVKNKTANEKTTVKAEPRRIQPQILLLTNFRGNVKTLKFADENKSFSLKLDMPGIDKAYKSYEVRIYDADNNLVVQQKLNDNLSLKKSGEKIEIRNLNKNKFRKNNTYKTYLVAYDEKNNVEELSLYDSFKVN